MTEPRKPPVPPSRRLPLPGDLGVVLFFFAAAALIRVIAAIVTTLPLEGAPPPPPLDPTVAAVAAASLAARALLGLLSFLVLTGSGRRPRMRRLTVAVGMLTAGLVTTEVWVGGASLVLVLELLVIIWGSVLLGLAPARRLFGEMPAPALPPGIAIGDGGLRARGLIRLFSVPLLSRALLVVVLLPALAVADGFGRLLAMAALATIVLALEPALKRWLLRRLFDARPHGFDRWGEPARDAWRRAVSAFRGGRLEDAVTAAREAARHEGAAGEVLHDFILLTRALAVRAQREGPVLVAPLPTPHRARASGGGDPRAEPRSTDVSVADDAPTTTSTGAAPTTVDDAEVAPGEAPVEASGEAPDGDDGDEATDGGSAAATAEPPRPTEADADDADDLGPPDLLLEMEIPDGISLDMATTLAGETEDPREVADAEREFPEIALLLLTRDYSVAERRSSLTREIQSIRGRDLARLAELQVAVGDAIVRAVESPRSPFRLIADRLLEGVTGRTFFTLAPARARPYWEEARRLRDLGRGFVLTACRLIERGAEPLARIAWRRARREGVGAVPDDRAARRMLAGLDAILEVYSFAEELRSGLTLDQARRRLEPLLWVVARDCGAFEYGTPLCGEVMKRSAEVTGFLRRKERSIGAVLELYGAYEEEVAFEASRVLRALRGPEDDATPRGPAGWRRWWKKVSDDGGLDRDLIHTLEGLTALSEGQPEAAKDAFILAVGAARQRRPFLYWNLAHALDAAGDREGALEACRELLRRAPGGDARYRLLPARILESSGLAREAEVAYRRACRASRGRDVAHYALGRFCYELGRYDDALRQFWMAREADPNDPDYPMAIGLVHLRLGHHREARDVLEPLRGRAGVPQAGLLFLLSRAYTGLGDEGKANELLKRVSSDERADPQTLEEIAHFLEERREFSLASDFAARALERRLADEDEDEEGPGFSGLDSDVDEDDEDGEARGV